MVKKVNGFVKKNQKSGATALLVLMGKNSDETKAKLKKLAKDHQIKFPLSINVDQGTAKKFKLNEKVKNTILIYKKKKVEANFALNKITEKDVTTVLTAAKTVAVPS